MLYYHIIQDQLFAFFVCVGRDREEVRGKRARKTHYLLATGLSLICMVLSSWLFVLGKLKLLFFRWRREQHEPMPCGEEDSEEVREPDLFMMEISMQLA